MAELVDPGSIRAIQATAWALVRELEALTAQGEALLRELDEAWGAPVEPADVETLFPSWDERPTLRA